MKLIFLYLLMRRLKRFWPQSSAAGIRKRQHLKYISRVGELQSSAQQRRRQTFGVVSIFPLILIFSIDTGNDWQLSWAKSLRLELRSKKEQVSKRRKKNGKISSLYLIVGEKACRLINTGQIIMTFFWTQYFRDHFTLMLSNQGVERPLTAQTAE